MTNCAEKGTNRSCGNWSGKLGYGYERKCEGIEKYNTVYCIRAVATIF